MRYTIKHLNVFLWVLPRGQIVICERFGNLCQFHFKGWVLSNKWVVREQRGIYTRAKVSSNWQDQ
jgi:hypothetical protein